MMSPAIVNTKNMLNLPNELKIKLLNDTIKLHTLTQSYAK